MVTYLKEQLRYMLHSAKDLIIKCLSLKMKKTLGDHTFLSATPNLIMDWSTLSRPWWGQFLMFLKIFLDLLLMCIVFNLLDNVLSVLFKFLGLFTLYL